MPASNTYRHSRPQRAVWNSHRWRTITRPAVRARANGLCELCGRPGDTADHYPTPCLTLMMTGGDPWDPDTCRWLCRTCSGKADGPRAARRFQGPKPGTTIHPTHLLHDKTGISLRHSPGRGGTLSGERQDHPKGALISLPAPRRSRVW